MIALNYQSDAIPFFDANLSADITGNSNVAAPSNGCCNHGLSPFDGFYRIVHLFYYIHQKE